LSIRRPPLPADRFTIIDNAWLRDPALSYRAKGVLAYVASHAAGHELTVEQIIGEGTEGREAVRTALRELEDAGYLARFPRRQGSRIVGTDFELREPDRSSTAQKPVGGADQEECREVPGQSTAQVSTAQESPPKKTTTSEDQKKTTTSFDAEASPNAGLIIKGYIDWLSGHEEPVKLTSSVIARLGKEIKSCLKDGIDEGTVKRALVEMARRGKAGWPSMLQSFVVEVQNRPVSAPPSAPRAPQFKNSAEQQIERARISKARSKILDALMDEGRTFDQAKAEIEGLTDEDFLKLVAPSTVTGYIEGDVINEQRPEVES